MMLQLLILFVDAFLVSVAFLAAFAMRYGLPLPQYNFAPYQDNYIFLTLIYLLVLGFNGVFKKRFASFWDVLRRVTAGLFCSMFLALSLLYVFRVRWLTFPSSIILIQFPVAVLLLFSVNSMILDAFGRIRRIVAILGAGGEQAVHLFNRPRTKVVCLEHAEQLLRCEDIHELVVSRSFRDAQQLNLLIYLLLRLRVAVLFDPGTYGRFLSASGMDSGRLSSLGITLGRKPEWEEFLMRLLDVLGSIALLVVLSPVLATIALLVKMSSPGPVFYRQTRVGKGGKHFTLYKFRTMFHQAEQDTGPVLAAPDDHRVTRVGRWLRKCRLDELPQLVNVIRGDMSLVGPRPERPYFVERHKVLQDIRLAVKPGLTGLAQIRNGYDLHPRHKIKYDYLYIQKRSALLNLYILVNTIPTVLRQTGR